jgi:hypothetical protein
VGRAIAYLFIVVVAALGAVAAVGTSGFGATVDTAAASGKPFDLVYISDSSGWGVARFYGREIEKARGVTVRVHDQWVSGLPAVTILERLRTAGDPWVSLVRNAEVIVVYGSPVGLEVVKGGDCVTSTESPLKVGPQVWVKYVQALKAIYKQIFEIRGGKPVILRTANYYVPLGSSGWKDAGILDICTKKFESQATAQAKAAAAYRVPVADVYTALNGTTHLEDPVAKGYIGSDGLHLNSKGRAVVAKTLADLGYRQVKPPR